MSSSSQSGLINNTGDFIDDLNLNAVKTGSWRRSWCHQSVLVMFWTDLLIPASSINQPSFHWLLGDFAKQGAKVVIDKIQGGGADGEGGAGGAGGEGQEDDKDKGNLLSGFLGGNDDKKEGGQSLAPVLQMLATLKLKLKLIPN